MPAYDITLPTPGPLCYYAAPFAAEPVRAGSFVGSVAEGGPVNHKEVRFAPHGTGTHTECYGHISADPEAVITNCLKEFRFDGLLVSVTPEVVGDDFCITLVSLLPYSDALKGKKALVLRTLPNLEAKRTRDYSGTNPPYLDSLVATFLVGLGIDHILVDLPSVDKEVDGGALSFHRQFWQTDGPAPLRKHATITELIFVPDAVADGPYTVFIAPAAWALDAAPSRIWLEQNL
jgi:kynurenine formamidase